MQTKTLLARSFFLATALSLTFLAGETPDSLAAQAKAVAAPRPVAAKAPEAQKAPAKASQNVQEEAKLKNTLDVFAKDCIVKMNRQRRPGIDHKEIKRQADGSFQARYLAVDPNSLETSFRPTAGHKNIKYIGRLDYHEVEYISTGKNQQQALAGPFSEINRVPITELIKYKSGKWSY